ncbi:MAG: NAD(P)-dependent oxidoreductase [Bacilli bacterium]|nr:NAD(P)-dependent oxidoreductase [Bacilli bacterium]
MKNIIITGATSFIGLNLINKLLEKDYNIFAIVRNNSSNINKLPKSKKLQTIELNMNEVSKLNNIIKEKCDIFVHLAWDGTRGKTRDDKELQEKNYQYSIDAINVSQKLGCDTFVGAGSQAEYGLYNCEVSELTPCNPVTEYGKAKLKLCNDGYSLCKKNNISFKWPRFFSLYGIEDYEGMLIISMIDKMLLNEAVNLTECVQMWNYLYIKDAIKALIKLIESKDLEGIYNFGSNDTRELKKYIEELTDILQTKSEIIYGAVPYPNTGMVSIHPNIKKLEKEINWKPEISFEEGIKEVILSRRKKLGVVK